MFLLDTSIYIEAFTDAAFGAAFRAFHQAALPQLALSAVVAHEVLVGATTPAKLRSVERGLLEPFRARRRLHVPTAATWTLAATVDRDLRAMKRYAGSLVQRSFANDLLLAASARELGATLVTLNRADFEVIAQVLPVRVVGPWPELA